MKFRKKPVVIDAFRLWSGNIRELEAWCGGAIKGIKLPSSQRCIDIQTLEGEMRAEIGDWIIRGVKGEFYSCKHDIFILTYEALEEEKKF